MIVAIFSVPSIGFSIQTTAWCNIRFTANDRFDSSRNRFFIEIDCAAHDSVIGNRKCVELQFCCAFHQSVQTACSIKKGELRMQMKMYKFRAQVSEFTVGVLGCQEEVVVDDSLYHM